MIKTALALVGVVMAFLMFSGVALLQAQGDKVARDLVQKQCASCHNLDRVKRNIGKVDALAWDDYVKRMQQNGARVTDPERVVIVEFLSSLKSGKDL